MHTHLVNIAVLTLYPQECVPTTLHSISAAIKLYFRVDIHYRINEDNCVPKMYVIEHGNNIQEQ